MTKADYTAEELQEIEAALATAQEAQTAFWTALSDLETAVGNHELNLDNTDLEGYDVDSILELVEDDEEDEDGLTDSDDDEDDDEDK